MKTYAVETTIRATPEAIWRALTDGDVTERYYFGSRVEATPAWKRGAAYRYPNPKGGAFIEGMVLDVKPRQRLVTTFKPFWQKQAGDDSIITWRIERAGPACTLTLHRDGNITANEVKGWSAILKRMKAVLEQVESTSEVDFTSSMSPSTAARKKYERIADTLIASDGVERARMFGMLSLTINGNALAAFHTEADRMVFRLEGAAHAKALAINGAQLWNPGKGKGPMKAWVAVPERASRQWRKLAQQALAFAQTMPAKAR